MDSWNDERMDELSGRVDAGFKEMREGFAQINRKLDQLPTREAIDHRFAAVHREANQRFESTERRIDRVNSRLEHMLWALIVVGGGFLGNLLAGKF